jgi:hypothetical protein
MNALLQHLAFKQLMQGTDKFCWNIHGNGKFFVYFMYRALLQQMYQ